LLVFHKLSNVYNDKFEAGRKILMIIFPINMDAVLILGIATSSIKSGGGRPLALQKNQHAIFDDFLVLPNVEEYVIDLYRVQDLFTIFLSPTKDAT
jgi:hypothetical protein